MFCNVSLFQYMNSCYLQRLLVRILTVYDLLQLRFVLLYFYKNSLSYVWLCISCEVLLLFLKTELLLYNVADIFCLDVVLIPNFERSINLNNIKRGKLRSKYKIKTQNVIVCVGAIDIPVKRTNYVLNEFYKFTDDWTLILVGKGNISLIEEGNRLGDRFKQMSFELNDVSINEIYQLADLKVFASVKDAFGNVIIEAMNNQTCVVAHDRELNEWILGDKELLIEMTKEGALYEFVNNHTVEWMHEKSRILKERFESKFTWEANKEDYTKLLFD